MFVRDIMSREPTLIAPEDTLMHARNLMKRERVRHLLVGRDGRLEGIITDRDIRDYLLKIRHDPSQHDLHDQVDAVHVDHVMKHLPVSTTPEDTVQHVAHSMLVHGIGCLPVVSEDRIVGVVTTSDVLRAVAAGTLVESDLSERVPEQSVAPNGRARRAAGLPSS